MFLIVKTRHLPSFLIVARHQIPSFLIVARHLYHHSWLWQGICISSFLIVARHLHIIILDCGKASAYHHYWLWQGICIPSFLIVARHLHIIILPSSINRNIYLLCKYPGRTRASTATLAQILQPPFTHTHTYTHTHTHTHTHMHTHTHTHTQNAHEDRNIARMLTPAERRDKKERRLFDDNGELTFINMVNEVYRDGWCHWWVVFFIIMVDEVYRDGWCHWWVVLKFEKH